ncbi:MAG TPA: type VI immunity family protein [Longimicrobium sp.]
MSWTDVWAEYAELGRSWTVLRPAVAMEFYGEGARLAAHGESILDRFLGLLPEGTQLYQLGNNSREYRKVDAPSLRRIRKTLAELEQRGRFYMIKDAPEFDVGGYSLELHLGSKHATINDRVHIALPLEFADEHRISGTIELFRELVTDVPFWGAVAGYGFDLPWGRECEMVAMPAMLRAALRFHGLLVRHRTQEDYAVKKLKSAGWLTFLDAELLGLVGGQDALEAAVDGLVEISPLRGGVLLKAGDRPPVGDVNRQEADVRPLAAVNRAISEIRLQRWFSHNLFSVPAETSNDWLSRFDRWKFEASPSR